MEATYIGTDEDRQAVTSYLSYYLRQVINGPDILIETFKQGFFLGSRPIAPLNHLVNVQDNGSSRGVTNGNHSYVALASSLSAAGVVALVVVYFITRRRRKNEDHSAADTPGNGKQEVVARTLDQVEMQPTMVPTKSSEVSPKSGSEKTIDIEKDLEKGSVNVDRGMGYHRTGPVDLDLEVPSTGAAVVSGALALGTVTSILTATTAATTQDGTDRGDLDDDATEVASNVIPSTPPAVIDVSLPPKPPANPSSKPPVPVPASKALKPKRRRKKKKKNAVPLKRSNSREKIAGMETINEGEEETSGDNAGSDGEGSEYSWYSTSDSEPGSRDPSPARSRGSREPSPARSTGSSGEIGLSTSGSWDASTEASSVNSKIPPGHFV
jgi:hypothetical protein